MTFFKMESTILYEVVLPHILSQLLSCWSPAFTCLTIITQLFLNPFLDEEGVRYVPVRPRPPITLLRHYRNPWKAAYHHFQRYSDVRVKGQSAAPTGHWGVRGERLQHTWCLKNTPGSSTLMSSATKIAFLAIGKNKDWSSELIASLASCCLNLSQNREERKGRSLYRIRQFCLRSYVYWEMYLFRRIETY